MKVKTSTLKPEGCGTPRQKAGFLSEVCRVEEDTFCFLSGKPEKRGGGLFYV